MDDKTNELLVDIGNASSVEIASKLWGELHAYSWEFLPSTKLGDFPKISVMSSNVEGYEYFNAAPILWNTTNSK